MTSASEPRALARQLTLPAAVALVIGQVVGVGIFLTPGAMIRTLASPLWVMVVWAAIGAMAICGALCYGALAARFPHAGGGYVYLREAYGRRLAFLYGWKCFLITDPGITAALATGFADYARYIVPLGPFAMRLVAIVAIVILALIHIVGVRPGTRVLATLAVLKLALIGGLIVLAFVGGTGSWQHFVPLVDRRPDAPPFVGAMAGALVSAFFSFGGWWEITKIAGEVRDPARTLPRALWMGLAVVTVVYMAATLAFIYVLPIEGVNREAFVAQVGNAILGPTGGTIVAAIVVICTLGSLGGMLMVAPRLYFAMAQDGLFPAAAAAVHPRFGTPALAIAVQAGLASILVALGTFDTIVAYFVFITVVFIALTVFSVFVLRARDPGWRVPGQPWTPAVFLVMVVMLLAVLAIGSPAQALLGTAIVLLGLPAYHVIGRSRVRA